VLEKIKLVGAIVGLTTVLLTLIAQDGAAQNQGLGVMLGTLDVEAKSNFADGKLNACMVEFNVLARDWVYKQGAYITIGGSFGVMRAGGQTLGAVLKVVLHDLDPGTMRLTPSPPVSAYFVSGNSTTKDAVVGSYPSDVPGAIFVVFQMDPTFSLILEGLSKDKVSFAFARKKGGSDIVVLIDTSVVKTAANGERTHSPFQAASEFVDCAKLLR
jgi:hypothetical protein